MATPEQLLALLHELDEGRGVALPRLAKRLDERVSTLLRDCTALSDARIGAAAGPGWVRLECDDGGRWTAQLTDAGRAHIADDAAAPPAPLQRFDVARIAAGTATAAVDTVAVEAPIALVFNGISQAVMMATPADLEAFALGFAVSEGLLASRDECFGIEVAPAALGIEVRLDVAAAAEMRLKERRRTLAGRTGCGLCGIDSLAALEFAPAPLASPLAICAGSVQFAFEQLAALQPLNAASGAHHAAGWARADGTLELVMEDVGRHNALDKLIGARLLARASMSDGFVVMSSRASYELVLKCARLGVPALATISAPTSLAVDIARNAGLRLYGFCRGESAVLYSDFDGESPA